MGKAITITLVIIAVLSALGGVAHESPNRGRNAAIIAVAAIAALATIAIQGG